MPISKSSLKQKLITAQGFQVNGEFAMAGRFAEAIANAVVDEITKNATVPIFSGSSVGSYKVT